MREEQSTANGIILKGSKMVIPSTMRKAILNKIHKGHLGIEKSRRRARETVYWPGMNSDISQMIDNCTVCLQFKPLQVKEPLIPHEVPNRPWQRVGADLCTFDGKEYLVVSDYYSLYPEVVTLRHGLPDILVSDNGPQFSSSEFSDFAKDWGVSHITSSPHFPQSNGLAESAVKTVKRLLQKSKLSGQDFYKGLLAYRATPLDNGVSPAQLLMQRRLKTTLPTHPALLKTENYLEAMKKKTQKKTLYDRAARELPPLFPGDVVRVRDYTTNQWSQGSKVVQASPSGPRSYDVLMDSGAVFRRNRRDIRSSPQNSESSTNHDMAAPDRAYACWHNRDQTRIYQHRLITKQTSVQAGS